MRLHAIFALIAASWTSIVAEAAPLYTVTNLGVLPSTSSSIALGLNASGQVVGYTDDRGFLWSPTAPNATTGAMADLGALENSSQTIAIGINTFGQVVGQSYGTGPDTAFLWTPASPNGSTGSMTPLNGIPSGLTAGNALSISDNGQIAVQGRDAQGSVSYALLWTPSTVRGNSGSAVNLALDSPQTIVDGVSEGINASGQVVGSANGRGFLWKPTAANGSSGTMYDLGSLDPVNPASEAHAINASGQIAGETHTSDANERPMLWTPDSPNGTTGTMLELSGLPDVDGRAIALNDAGLVVGSFGRHNHQYTPALWLSPSQMTDLNTALDASGARWLLQEALGINNSGQIVGWGFYDPDGPGGVDEVQRGFLLTPAVPEPASIALIAGVLAAACRRRH